MVSSLNSFNILKLVSILFFFVLFGKLILNEAMHLHL
jgi:hypothetical protein